MPGRMREALKAAARAKGPPGPGNAGEDSQAGGCRRRRLRPNKKQRGNTPKMAENRHFDQRDIFLVKAPPTRVVTGFVADAAFLSALPV